MDVKKCVVYKLIFEMFYLKNFFYCILMLENVWCNCNDNFVGIWKKIGILCIVFDFKKFIL